MWLCFFYHCVIFCYYITLCFYICSLSWICSCFTFIYNNTIISRIVICCISLCKFNFNLTITCIFNITQITIYIHITRIRIIIKSISTIIICFKYIFIFIYNLSYCRISFTYCNIPVYINLCSTSPKSNLTWIFSWPSKIMCWYISQFFYCNRCSPPIYINSIYFSFSCTSCSGHHTIPIACYFSLLSIIWDKLVRKLPWRKFKCLLIFCWYLIFKKFFNHFPIYYFCTLFLRCILFCGSLFCSLLHCSFLHHHCMHSCFFYIFLFFILIMS